MDVLANFNLFTHYNFFEHLENSNSSTCDIVLKTTTYIPEKLIPGATVGNCDDF